MGYAAVSFYKVDFLNLNISAISRLTRDCDVLRDIIDPCSELSAETKNDYPQSKEKLTVREKLCKREATWSLYRTLYCG